MTQASPDWEGPTLQVTLEQLLDAHQSLNECCNGEPMEVTGLSRPCLDSMAKTLRSLQFYVKQ